MSTAPLDFLESAKKFLGETDEISTRNAISRAYYAAYHSSQEVFEVDPEFRRRSSSGVHTTYIDQLMQSEPGSPQRLTATKLSTLKGKRAAADYDLRTDIRPYVAPMQISSAEELLALHAEINMSTDSVSEGATPVAAEEATPIAAKEATPAPQEAPRPLKLKRVL